MSVVTANSINSLTGNFVASFIFGLLATIIFFFSIFLHEFAHGVAARMENVPVVEIVLHPFGGLTRLKHEPETPRAEFRIAIAGPVASFLLALLFLGFVAFFDYLGAKVLVTLFFLLCLLNFLVAVFNLFPGYPLDGGRVLRAYLWRRGTNLNEATILTGRFGQIIAAVLICFGIFIALQPSGFFTGFWSVIVGLFLYDAAKGIIRQMGEAEKILVGDVMGLAIAVKPETDVQHFVDHILTVHPQKVFPVAKDRQLYGILALEDLQKLPREKWHETKIQTVMRAITPDYFVETITPLLEAKELMRINGINALGVIDQKGNLVGFLQNKVTKQKMR
jgi:Zn-dependent protease/CBS domain-containing protein